VLLLFYKFKQHYAFKIFYLVLTLLLILSTMLLKSLHDFNKQGIKPAFQMEDLNKFCFTTK